MKKSELKKALKPLIQECIRETLYESGLLSSIISEVVQGVMEGQKVITEASQPKPTQRQTVQSDTNRQRNEAKATALKETKKNLLDSIGKSAYNGVDLFEGTTPLKSGGSPSASPSSGPFSGVDPNDSGVNIDGLTESLGGVWRKLAEGGKK